MAAAFRNSTPRVAPKPVATMMDIGVARPKAQGQAMIRTATALTNPNTQLGSGPKNPHPMKVREDIAKTAATK